MKLKDIEQFQESLKDIGIAGNDLAIYVKGREVYRYMTGYQNIEKGIRTNRDTMYKMFSMTKPITCAAALQLFEKGKFLLNEPLCDYLPEFKQMKVRVGKEPGAICLDTEEEQTLKDAENLIEIQHLFEMGAGLDYALETEQILALAKRTDWKFTTAEFVKAIADRPLVYEPGTHWVYSLAHDVIGRLIEVWSDMRFGDYVKKNIFEPLGMTTATFHTTEEQNEHLMLRYGFGEDGKTFELGDQVNHYQMSPNLDSGGAGSSMTVDDYGKFAMAMANRGVGANGERILAGRTIDLMKENFLTPEQNRDMFESSKSREGYGYGLGVRTLVDRAVCGDAGPKGAEFGWGGAWGTYTCFDTADNVALVYAEQAVDTQSVYIQRRIRNMVYAALEWEGLI